MKLVTPSYYRTFHCTADACRDNCCRGGWLVGIDEQTEERYRKMPGALGQKLRAALFKQDGETFLKHADEDCPMLEADGLCAVVKEAGPEALGVVCDQFPRFSEDFGERKETGVGLACEEAARIVLTSAPEEARLTESGLAEEPYEDDEYEKAWDDRVRCVRAVFDGMLEHADTSGGFNRLFEALQAMLLSAADLQMDANKNDFAAFDRKAQALAADGGECAIRALAGRLRPCVTNAAASRNQAYIGLFTDLESIGKAWDEELSRLRSVYGTEPFVSHFPQRAAGFEAEHEDLSHALARYARYLHFRYFGKAVYDHDILGKCKQTALFTLMLEMMLMADWKDENGTKTQAEPGQIPESLAASVHLFSRQVEYDEENMEQIAEDLTFERCVRTDELICALSHYTKQIG